MEAQAGGRWAKWWHLATAVVGVFALVLQLILVISGASVLVVEDPPNLPTRLLRFITYFTVQSNILVLLTAVNLFRAINYDRPRWRILRLDAVVGIAVTGLEHFFLLRSKAPGQPRGGAQVHGLAHRLARLTC